MRPPGRPRGGRKKVVPGISTSVYLEVEIDQALNEYVERSIPRVTKSAVIRAAIRQFLEQDGRGAQTQC
jgi:Arc/MetJ-type ribon-helix-helix transcriptional regulator